MKKNLQDFEYYEDNCLCWWRNSKIYMFVI